MPQNKSFFAIIRSDEGFRVYENPIEIICCRNTGDIIAALQKLDAYSSDNKYSAGFISYEAGYVLNRIKNETTEYDFPLLHFGVFESFKTIAKASDIIKIPSLRATFSEAQFFALDNIKVNEKYRKYCAKIKRIIKMIEKGTFYQLNYSIKLDFGFRGNPLLLFLSLLENQNTKYSSFINTGENTVLSLSPELFFDIKEGKITVKPMKGTISRGKTSSEDIKNKEQLKKCAKNLAENLMIVDLLRNDIGKISKTGSVCVKELFEIEEYPTLFQMVSTVKSVLKSGIPLHDIFLSLFPCGSVTGAPKIMAMNKIKLLENRQRKVFSAAAGYIDPTLNMRFSVGIRTVLLERSNKDKLKGELGIGSGIVYDSNAKGEYNECLLKAVFLKDKSFYLIETMLYDIKMSKITFFNMHLKRLKNSAAHFKIVLNTNKISREILQKTAGLKCNSKIRVRLYKNGEYSIDISDFNLTADINKKAFISDIKIQDNPHIYYKTSMRHIYDLELNRARDLRFYDVIFKNTKNEITESAFNNIFIEDDSGMLFTPHLSSGLLNGILRQNLILSKKASEKVIYGKDIFGAKNVFLGNSLRGLVKIDILADF